MKLSEIEKGFEQFYPNGEKCEFTAHAAAQICEVIMKPKNINTEQIESLASKYVDRAGFSKQEKEVMKATYVNAINEYLELTNPISTVEA